MCLASLTISTQWLLLQSSRGLPATFNLHQFAYGKNRQTEDAIAIALHTTLTHLEQKDSYVRLLFIDISSAVNTIVPARLVTKLHDLLRSSCLWIKDFLSDRAQRVKTKQLSIEEVLVQLLEHDEALKWNQRQRRMWKVWKTTQIVIQTLKRLTSQQRERHLRRHSSPRVNTCSGLHPPRIEEVEQEWKT